MDETIKSDGGYLVGAIAVALGVLKFLFGKARTASVDDKYEKRFEEFERKMELALSDHRRSIRKELEDFVEKQEHNEQRATEFQRRVLSTVDDLTANLQSLRRAFASAPAPESHPHPPSRLR